MKQYTCIVVLLALQLCVMQTMLPMKAVGATAQQFFERELAGTVAAKEIMQVLEKFGLKADTYVSEEMQKVLAKVVDDVKLKTDLAAITKIPEIKVSVFSKLKEVPNFNGFGKFDAAALKDMRPNTYQVILKDFVFKAPAFKEESILPPQKIVETSDPKTAQRVHEAKTKYDEVRQNFYSTSKDLRDAIQSRSKEALGLKIESEKFFEQVKAAHENLLVGYDQAEQAINGKIKTLTNRAEAEMKISSPQVTERGIELPREDARALAKRSIERDDKLTKLFEEKQSVLSQKNEQLAAFQELEIENNKPFDTLGLLQKENLYLSNAETLRDWFDRSASYIRDNKLQGKIVTAGVIGAAALLVGGGVGVGYYLLSSKSKKAKDGAAQPAPALDVTIQQLLAAPEIKPHPGEVARHLRMVNNTYYQLLPSNPQDTDTLIVTTFNATNEARDSGMGCVYISAPAAASARVVLTNKSYIVQGVALELLRAQMGVKVGADGKQELIAGFEVPALSINTLVALQGSEAQLKNALTTVLQKQNMPPEQQTRVISTVNASRSAIEQASKAGLLHKQIRSAGGLFAQTNAVIEDCYFEGMAGRYVARIQDGNDTYYLDIETGYAYDSSGKPRIRALTLEASTVVPDVVLVSTKDKQNKALWHTDSKGLKRIEFQHPNVKGSVAAAALSTGNRTSIKNESGRELYRNEYNLFALVQDAETKAMITVALKVTESPVDKNSLLPLPETTYQISEDRDGQLDDVGTYRAAQNEYCSMLWYYNTRVDGVDKGFVSQDAAYVNPAACLWNGDDKRQFTQIYYRNRLLPLALGSPQNYTATLYGVQLVEDENLMDRLVTDESKKRTIRIAQTTRKLPAGLVEDIVTIVDGNKEYDFKYAPNLINDIDRFNRNVLGLVPVAGVYRITQLAVIIPDKLIGLQLKENEIKNVRKLDTRVIEPIKKAFASVVIKKTKDNMHFLYTIRQNDLKGLFVGLRLDLSNGIIYDLLGVPLYGVSQEALETILDKLGLRVGYDDKQRPYVTYYQK